MSEEPEMTTGGDPGMLVAEIKALLGIDVENDTDVIAVLRAIRDWAKKNKGKGETEGGEGEGGDDGSESVASSARQALGLSEDANGDAVTVAINTLKQGATGAKTLDEQVRTLTEQMADRDARDLLQPYVNRGVLDPKNERDWKIFTGMARKTPEDAKHVLDQRVAVLPMSGQTTAPAHSDAAGDNGEDVLIANAMKEHKGQYGDAIVAVQKQLLDDHCERTGHSRKRAVGVLEKQYPKIFGVAA